MRTILIRLAELLSLCFIGSSVTCALYYYHVIANTDLAYFLTLSIAVAIFIAKNISMLLRCYYELPILKTYYLLNYSAYGIFMLIGAVVYLLFGEIPYAWMFNTLKLATFSILDLHALASTALTHLVMLIVIAVIPFTARKHQRSI